VNNSPTFTERLELGWCMMTFRRSRIPSKKVLNACGNRVRYSALCRSKTPAPHTVCNSENDMSCVDALPGKPRLSKRKGLISVILALSNVSIDWSMTA
jgi:hypothetical protein